MENSKKALEIFNEGFNCCQSVISAFAEDLGLDYETALKISTSFGGGIASNKKVCGALTGAFMVLGLKYGRTNLDDSEIKDKNYILVNKLIEIFKEKYNGIDCEDLLRENLKDEDKKRETCSEFVKTASEYLENL